MQPHPREGRCVTHQRFGRLCRIPKVFLQSFEGTEHHGRNVQVLNLLLRLRFKPFGLDKRSCAAAGTWQVGLSAASVTDGRQAILSLLPSFPRHVVPTSPSSLSRTRFSCRSSRASGRANTPVAAAAAEAVTLLGGVGLPVPLPSTWHTDLEKKLSRGKHRHVRASSELDRRTKARVRRTCFATHPRICVPSETILHVVARAKREAKSATSGHLVHLFETAALLSFASSLLPHFGHVRSLVAVPDVHLRVLRRAHLLSRRPRTHLHPHLTAARAHVRVHSHVRAVLRRLRAPTRARSTCRTRGRSRKAGSSDVRGRWRTRRRRWRGPGGAWRGFRRRGRAYDVARGTEWSGRCA